MNFNFGEVLSRAWQIVWKHKVLWIFGIFGLQLAAGSKGQQIPVGQLAFQLVFQSVQQVICTPIIFASPPPAGTV